MGRKRDTVWWRGDVDQRRGSTREEKGRRLLLMGWREFYWAKK
jgi:hypothetical protein